MKKYLSIIFTIIFMFFMSMDNTYARSINLYFFHGEGCPHCAEEEKYLDSIDNKNVKIIEYEVWYNEENSTFLNKIGDTLEFNTKGVPVTIIGESHITGFSDTTGDKINRAIKYYTNDDNDYIDAVNEIKNGAYVKTEDTDKKTFEKDEKKSDKDSTISVPLFGKVNLKKFSLFSSAVIIGLVDGFNPCAMWVLLFLISILIGMKDRRKMWVIGLCFLFTSAFVYFLIMMSWLNIVIKISDIVIIRDLIALFAVGGGIYNLYNFYKSKDSGCEVVDDKRRKKIFKRIKEFCNEKSLLLAACGACVLAISVNLVELACSAGLPVVFTQLLAINNIDGVQSILYTLLYILFFMLDDLIIFSIAMFTTKITAISTKFNKYSHLIGGIIMLLIGILLLFKPGWLMFNFK